MRSVICSVSDSLVYNFRVHPRLADRQLSAIIEWSDDAIVSKDLDGIITSWNRAAERMFGFTAEEAVGQSIRMIIPADRQREEDEVLARIRRGEVVNHFETWRQRKDGRQLPISLTISPIRDDDGVVVGASKIARDISERHRANQALADAATAQRELQARLETLLAASHTLLLSPKVEDVVSATVRVARQLLPSDACAVWRRDASTTEWHIVLGEGLPPRFDASTTRGWQPLTSPRVVVDIDPTRLSPQDLAALHAESIRSYLVVPLAIGDEATGILVFYYRSRHVFTDVERRTADAIASLVSAALTTAALYDAQRASRWRSELLAQVTAHMAAATTDREILSHVVHRLVPQLGDWAAAVLVDVHGSVERVATATTEHVSEAHGVGTESQPSDASGRPVTATQVTVGLGQVLRDGLPVLLSELHGAAPDGLVGAQSYIAVPLIARGRTLGALAIASGGRDTPFSHADLLLAQDLASSAALAIDNAQVYEALRRADRMKDEFLATLSHELRTPLNAILGYAQMLRRGSIPEDRRERAFEVLERNASTLSQIVDDVLDVSRIVSGKVRLDIVPVDLVRVLLLSVETVQSAADAKGVQLETDLALLTGTLMGDVDRLQQVCWNLLFNAVKFTPRGGTVQVRLRETASDVVLTVRDTGVGIAADYLDLIFERFRQADSRFAREHGGLGLGLAICRHFTELHGGQIVAESDGLGHGATFRVTLPLAPRTTALVAQTVARARSPQ